jgi:hypothetical protein
MKYCRSNILPLPKTIFQWLLLVVLSTGSFLFREISGNSLYRIEYVSLLESAPKKQLRFNYSFKATARTTLPVRFLFEQNSIDLSQVLQFTNLTETYFRILLILFLSFFFLLFRRMALPVHSYAIHRAHSPFLLS